LNPLYGNRSNYLIIFMLHCARNCGHGGLVKLNTMLHQEKYLYKKLF